VRGQILTKIETGKVHNDWFLLFVGALDPKVWTPRSSTWFPCSSFGKNQAPLVRNPKKPQKEEEEVVLARLVVVVSEGLDSCTREHRQFWVVDAFLPINKYVKIYLQNMCNDNQWFFISLLKIGIRRKEIRNFGLVDVTNRNEIEKYFCEEHLDREPQASNTTRMKGLFNLVGHFALLCLTSGEAQYCLTSRLYMHKYPHKRNN